MENYTLVKKIGKGNYGDVWLIINKQNRKQYVLKQINMRHASKQEQRSAFIEVKLLSSLKHPNIVSYFDSFQNPNGMLDIIMGYCERGDLYTFIRNRKGVLFQEKQIVEWFIQICMALQYLHERNILHRDLKTQNIFLTKSKIIKVGDLGIARILDSTCDLATTLIGTPYYMSPELFANQPYNHKSDIWALGCCLYEISTLRHAFNAWDLNSLMYKILLGKLPIMPKYYSVELINLISSMLNYDPNIRPSVKSILQNEFMRKHIKDFLQETSICNNQIKEAKKPLPTEFKSDNGISIKQRKTYIENATLISEKNNLVHKDNLNISVESKDMHPNNSTKENLFDKKLISNNKHHESIENSLENPKPKSRLPNCRYINIGNSNEKDYKNALEMNLIKSKEIQKNDKFYNSENTNSELNKPVDFHLNTPMLLNVNETNSKQCKDLTKNFQMKLTSNASNIKQQDNNIALFDKLPEFGLVKTLASRRRRRAANVLRNIEKSHSEISENSRPLPLPPQQYSNNNITAVSEIQQKSIKSFDSIKDDDDKQVSSSNLHSILKPNLEARRRRREKLQLSKKENKDTKQSLYKNICSVNKEQNLFKEDEKEGKNDLEIQEFIGLLNNTLKLNDQQKQPTEYLKNAFCNFFIKEDCLNNNELLSKSHIIQRIHLLKRECIKMFGEYRLKAIMKNIEFIVETEILQEKLSAMLKKEELEYSGKILQLKLFQDFLK